MIALVVLSVSVPVRMAVPLACVSTPAMAVLLPTATVPAAPVVTLPSATLLARSIAMAVAKPLVVVSEPLPSVMAPELAPVTLIAPLPALTALLTARMPDVLLVNAMAPLLVVRALATVMPVTLFNAIPPLPVAEMAALTLIVVAAFSVRLFTDAQLTGLLTMIDPRPPPPEVVASTMTELLASAVCRSVVFRLEVAAVVLVSVAPVVPCPDELAAVLIVMSVGSSNNVPVAPCAARVSTVPWKTSVPLPEVSTKPPWPDVAPPRASIAPLKSVLPSAQTLTVPPSPAFVALALMRTSAPTCVRCAVATPPWPCTAPPTCTVPPPAAPEALMVAWPVRLTASPSTCTEPPFWPEPEPPEPPDTSIAPLTTVLPPIARSVITPSCCAMLLARSTPDWFTAVASAPPAVWLSD